MPPVARHHARQRDAAGLVATSVETPWRAPMSEGPGPWRPGKLPFRQGQSMWQGIWRIGDSRHPFRQGASMWRAVGRVKDLVAKDCGGAARSGWGRPDLRLCQRERDLAAMREGEGPCRDPPPPVPSRTRSGEEHGPVRLLVRGWGIRRWARRSEANRAR